MTDQDFYELLQKRNQERKAKMTTERQKFRNYLRTNGITKLEAEYDAYGDSGNVDSITLTPDSLKLDNQKDIELRDFIWSVAYVLHPGFENNDGGYGELVWDLATDTINVEHSERFTDVNHYSYEDVR